MIKQTVRKSFTAVVAVALVAGSLTATNASASDRGFEVRPVKKIGKVVTGPTSGQRKSAAIGALVGIGGLLLGAAVANSRARDTEVRRQEFVDEGFRPARYGVERYEEAAECYDKPIKRYDRATGRVVIVGTTEVCD